MFHPLSASKVLLRVLGVSNRPQVGDRQKRPLFAWQQKCSSSLETILLKMVVVSNKDELTVNRTCTASMRSMDALHLCPGHTMREGCPDLAVAWM